MPRIQTAQIIEAELPAIISWFIVGAQRLLARDRYVEPVSSAEAVAKWRRAADQVRAFVDERTSPLAIGAAIRDGTGATELYQSYKRWAYENGHRAMASNKFGERMGRLELHSQHINTGAFYPVQIKFR